MLKINFHRAAANGLVLFALHATGPAPATFAQGNRQVDAPSAAASASTRTVEFNRDIRPILSDNCFACHGPDGAHRQADLRLDVREQAIDSKAIVPTQPKQSSLIERIRSQDADKQMPPPDSHKKLTSQQKDLLEQWIAQGATYQKHWAYESPAKPVIPQGHSAIDYLVQQKLDQLSLPAGSLADRRTLVRRLYADLIGLPPTPEAVQRFVEDDSADAYEKLVEQLLADPHYGERMAIGWLDVVRYADTCGYHSDNPRNVWPYRDWVIHSFNRNKPFDRFTHEQIAGDLLPDSDQEAKVGSAFNRLLLSTEEGGAQPKDYEARMLTDRVRAIGTAWLGQTTGCAQCHDHKFDPFTTADFYRLGAFFADIKEPVVGRREDGMPICPQDRTTEYGQLVDAVKAAQLQLDTAPEDTDAKSRVKDAQAELKRFESQLPHCLVSTSMPERRVVRILPRGNWQDESGAIVQPGFPGYLPQPNIGDRQPNRLDLAQWLVSRDNPLTARCVMNRLWKQYFGVGLSRVLEDLGAQGEPPVNAELLDWLACEFMDSGWNMKHMVRLMVTSQSYRRTSSATAQQRTVDPLNRYSARQTPYRLDAELIRDNALCVSGLLRPEIGGPSIKPYQPDGYWENLNFPTREYDTDKDQNQYRRGLYIWWQRSFLHPSLLAFDAPNREECAADRNRSNLPQQSLVLLNDPTYVEAARALAQRTLTECKGDTEARITWAWQQVLQRPPNSSERAAIAALLERQLARYRQEPSAAQQLLNIGLTPSPTELEPIELAGWTHVARVLLNLHETITRS